MSAAAGRASLRLETQLAARRPWIPSTAALRRWAAAAHGAAQARARRGATEAAAMPAGLCIRVVGAAASRRLNREYRGKDRPTNVLSFPASPEARALTGAIGDVVVCAPVVAAEARVQRKARDAHWAHIVVHGVLHLHGYDHERSARAAREMEALEVEILRGFGYLDPYSPLNPRNYE
jgi:probable rRNA maturation factor